MTTIFLKTEIDADIDRCFDTARDIDIHKLSTEKTNEKAIAGRTTGLCELGDTITWEAKHFGLKQRLTVEITKFQRPYFFEDKMLKGAFKTMRHEHRFENKDNKTVMTDTFVYEVPLGFIGQLFDRIVLKQYMTKFLLTRNAVMKSIVEAVSNEMD